MPELALRLASVLLRLLPALMLAPTLPAAARAEPPRVIATIAPIHSLVAAVMKGVGEPTLLLGPGDSAHTYSLRPSDAAALQDADLVFRVGAGLETFLSRPLAVLADQATVVTMAESPGVSLLPARLGVLAGGPVAVDVTAPLAPDNRTVDPHLWLDPRNAQAFLSAIALALSKADPANATLYAANAAAEAERLAALDSEIADALEPARSVPFLTLHDAFLYLETRYDLNGLGALTISPDRQPGAEGIRAIRDVIAQTGTVCIFAEPQFQPRLISVAAEGLPVRIGILDPIETGVAPGPDFYVEMMRANSQALLDCLLPSSTQG